MRPRHKAAENDLAQVQVFRRNVASMRPRHKAAENEERSRPIGVDARASMRPRHKAAENLIPYGTIMNQIVRFNEAAA